MTDIFVVGRDGSGLRRLTDDHGVAGTANWSPDGKTIVYYRAPASEIQRLNALNNSGTTQIVSIDVSSGAARTLTRWARCEAVSALARRSRRGLLQSRRADPGFQ
jgi:Tol biopolymer transport system component